jgi:hypothetical protein
VRLLANVATGLPKPHNYSNGPHRNRRYGPASALVILAVAIGIVLVLLVDWLNTLPNPLAR